jgi:hypothetical protein
LTEATVTAARRIPNKNKKGDGGSHVVTEKTGGFEHRAVGVVSWRRCASLAMAPTLVYSAEGAMSVDNKRIVNRPHRPAAATRVVRCGAAA